MNCFLIISVERNFFFKVKGILILFAEEKTHIFLIYQHCSNISALLNFSLNFQSVILICSILRDKDYLAKTPLAELILGFILVHICIRDKMC